MPFHRRLQLFLMLNGRYLWRRRLLSIICICGIALGVAIVVSVHLANRLALQSFERAVDAVAGKATHQIVGAGTADVDETIFPEVWNHPGIVAAAPVVEAAAAVPEAGSEVLRILGTDPFLDEPFRAYSSTGTPKNPGKGLITAGDSFDRFLSEDRRILLSARFARRHRLKAGKRLRVVVGTITHDLLIHGLFQAAELSEGTDNLAVMDLAAAQELFGMAGRLSRIDLISAPKDSLEKLTTTLPPGVRLERSETRSGRTAQMVRSFQMNLTALSFLGLFVGIFLIHNTLTFSVIQRRRQIGVLRCLGASRRMIALLFLGEAALLGTAGSIAGLVVGTWLTHYTAAAVRLTVNQIYTRIPPAEVTADWATVLYAVLLGTGSSVLAAAMPSYEASHVQPTAALSRPDLSRRVQGRIRALAAAGIGVLLLGALLAVLPVRSALPGFASAFLILAGSALLAPAGATLFASATAGPLARAGAVIPSLGVRNIVASLSRTGPAIASLLAALAMMIGVTLMVESFRSTLERWISQTIRADVFIQPAAAYADPDGAYLPQELLQALEANPQSESVDLLTRRELTVRGRPAHLNAIRFDLATPRSQDRFRAAAGKVDIRRLCQSDAVLISDTLASFTGFRRGDTILLPTPSGDRPFRIEDVYRDYSADGGQILIDRSRYRKYWHDLRVNNAAIYLRPGTDVDAALERLRSGPARPFQVLIRSNAGLKREILAVFDDTFAITYVMALLSLIVAFCGILFALLALLLERTRELATFRAIGMSSRQLVFMLYVESGATGVIALILGSAAGTGLAMLLVSVINVRSFGWTIDLGFSPHVFVTAAAVALAAAFLAAIYPAIRLCRLPLAEALREE